MRDGWARVTLGDVLTRRTDRLGENPEPRILTVTEGSGLVDQMEHWGRRVATEDVSKYKLVRPHDIVYNVYLLWLGAIGQNHFGELGVTSPVYEVFSPNQGVDPRYLGLLVGSPRLIEQYGELAIGTIPRRRRTPWQSFLQISVPLPPLEEQRRIVDLIGNLDDTIVAAGKSIEALEDLWWASTGRLESDCSGLPLRQLGEISDIHGGLTKNKKDAERTDVVEAPYLRVANVLRRRLALDEVATIVAARSRVEAAQLHPGDILMNEGGDRDKLGRGAVWRGEIPGCTHQNHVFRVRITEPGFVPEFVSAWANSFGQKWFDIHGSQTTGIASISKTTLSRFPVPALPRELQEQWAVLLDSVAERQWQTEELTEHLRSVRSNLLSALLSGAHKIPETYDAMMSELTLTLV